MLSILTWLNELIGRTVSQLGTISGPLIGGALTDYASWRWCEYYICKGYHY